MRLLYGGRNSLFIGIGAALITTLLSVIVGLLAGYFRGWTDAVLARILDVIWAYPVILLGVALGTALSLGGLHLGPIEIDSDSKLIPVIIIAVVYVPYMARPLRGQVLALREKEFVEAARAQGASSLRIMASEILPNLASTIVVFVPLMVANAILLEAALSFVGAGVRPPEPTWGTMISEGVNSIITAPHLTIVPGVMLVLTVLSLNVFGDGVRDALDPRARLRMELLGPMARFAVRRLASMFFVLFAISVLTFTIFTLIPGGDPAVRMAGRNANNEQIAAIRKDFGFDQPAYVQYGRLMEQVFTGELESYSSRLNVLDEIVKGIPRTFSLAIGAAILWMFFAVALGLITALLAGRFADRLLTVVALIGVSMPVFWVGALMNYYLGFKAGLFPNGGYVPLTEDPVQWAYHLIMPWTALSLLFIGVYSRILRSNILDTINDDYVRTARAKGLSERRVLVKHVLRNSMIPIITLWGLDFGAVLGGGAILTETVFDLQGVGQYAAESIQSLDQPPVIAITIFGAFFIVLLSAIVDIVYAVLDPRIRLT